MSVTSFRGYPLVNGAISTNDCLYAMLPPFYGWSIASIINAVVDSFYANAAFIVTGDLTTGISIKHPQFTEAFDITATLDSGVKTKKQVFDSALISEKVN